MATEQTVTLPVSEHPVTYDVVVVGGGVAGVTAAIAVAESGKRVLIVEREYALGGSATLAQVTPLMTVRVDGVHNSSVSCRLQRLMEEREYTCSTYPMHMKNIFSPVMLRSVLEEMCADAGVELLYGAALVNICGDGRRLDGVLVQTLSGLLRIRAHFVIDATGDAQVAYLAGCPYEAGNPHNEGKNQDMSLRFTLGGVDVERLKYAVKELGEDIDLNCPVLEISTVWHTPSPLTALFQKGVEDGALTFDEGVYFQAFSAPSLGQGVMYFNCPEAVHVHDATDPQAITQAVLDCRRSITRLHNFLKAYLAGFENSFLISYAEIPGVRESRRIIGEYVLSVDDYNERKKFPDAIAQTAYPLDVHGSEGLFHPRPMEPGEYHEVPYRCLIPQGPDNLLVAGRCVSASFEAQSAIRIQLTCRAMGEAAGIAAAMACERGCTSREVDGAAVRAEMIRRGGQFIGQE